MTGKRIQQDPENPICRKSDCGVFLIAPDNWLVSNKANKRFICKKCVKSANGLLYEANKDDIRKKQKTYRDENNEYVNTLRRASHAADPSKKRTQNKKHRLRHGPRYNEAARIARSDPVRSEHIRDLQRKNVKRNFMTIRTKRLQWYQENRVSVIAKVIAYQKAHPEMCAARAVRRRARKNNGFVPNANQAAIEAKRKLAKMMMHHGRKKFEVDHIRPFALGGLHHEDNLVVMTKRLNTSKGANDWPWLRWFNSPSLDKPSDWIQRCDSTDGEIQS